MRPGLVLVGGLFVVIAAATVVSVNVLPSTATETDRVSLPPQVVGPGGSGMTLLTGTNTSSGSFQISYTASVPVNVTLYRAPGCSSASARCEDGAPVWQDEGAGAGSGTVQSPLTFPYLMVWHSDAATEGNFSATGVEVYTTAVPPNLLTTLLVDAVAGALGAVGAVLVFLGLFLRGGVYRGPAPVVSRSAEDVEEISRPPGPPRG